MKILYLKLVLVVLLLSCQKEPEKIDYGNDSCQYCRMLITETRFGGELITSKGKIYKYDSIECLAFDQRKYNVEDIHSMWVIDYTPPHKLLNTKSSLFLLSENLKSPMGLNLSAYGEGYELDVIKDNFGGEEIQWDEVVEYVAQSWN